MGEWLGGLAKVGSAVVRAGRSALAKLTDSEQLKTERGSFSERAVESLLDRAQDACMHAHHAILGSENEPVAQDQHRTAVVLGFRVVRDVVGQFSDGGEPPRLPPFLPEAIREFRAAVSNDDNLAAGTAEVRAERIAAIDAAEANLEAQIRSVAYRNFGVGTGAWTARRAARGDPTKR